MPVFTITLSKAEIEITLNLLDDTLFSAKTAYSLAKI